MSTKSISNANYPYIKLTPEMFKEDGGLKLKLKAEDQKAYAAIEDGRGVLISKRTPTRSSIMSVKEYETAYMTAEPEDVLYSATAVVKDGFIDLDFQIHQELYVRQHVDRSVTEEGKKSELFVLYLRPRSIQTMAGQIGFVCFDLFMEAYDQEVACTPTY